VVLDALVKDAFDNLLRRGVLLGGHALIGLTALTVFGDVNKNVERRSPLLRLCSTGVSHSL
jgi:hypothetical protein